MNFIPGKKISITFLLALCIVVFQGIAQQNHEEEEKSDNLKVLPKHISAEDLHKIMKEYAKSLGVRCGHCHTPRKDNPEKLDFASDEKPEKATARHMIRMTSDINKKYIAKFGKNKLEPITCVTCHMGRVKPVVSVDSLAKK